MSSDATTPDTYNHPSFVWSVSAVVCALLTLFSTGLPTLTLLLVATTFALSAVAVFRKNGWLLLPVGATLIAVFSLIISVAPGRVWGLVGDTRPFLSSSLSDDEWWKQAIESDKQNLRYEAQQRTIAQLTLPYVIQPVDAIGIEDSGIPRDSQLWDRLSASGFSSAEGSWAAPAKIGRAAVGLHCFVKVTGFETNLSLQDVPEIPTPLPRGHVLAKIELDAVRNLGVISETGVDPVEVSDLHGNVYDPVSFNLNLLGQSSLHAGNSFTYTAFYVVPAEGEYRAVLEVGSPVWDHPLSGTYFVELP